jgi:phosphohistidine swiveling domain-containing protein
LIKLAAFKDTARAWINSLFLPQEAPLNRFVRLMQERYKCSALSIENRTLAELADAKCERKPSDTNMDPYIIWSVGNTRGLVTGGQAQVAITLMAGDDDFDPKASALRGTVANGSADTIIGVARIVVIDYANVQAMQASIDQMNAGEILIAEFTAPELLLACKKAKAIVTDIGGLLSHAAIVSRELNVPCLVGTKHGSKLFKTGDSVKIDLKIGVISKLG